MGRNRFFPIILGLFVFNFGKYLFLFHNIMKMIGEMDSANEWEKTKKTLKMLSWLCHRMLREKWKSIFIVTAAGAWAVALPTSWEASALEDGEEAGFHTSQVWKRKWALWVFEKASFKMLQDIDRKWDPSQCPSSGECGISIHWIYVTMDIVWIYPYNDILSTTKGMQFWFLRMNGEGFRLIGENKTQEA